MIKYFISDNDDNNDNVKENVTNTDEKMDIVTTPHNTMDMSTGIFYIKCYKLIL